MAREPGPNDVRFPLRRQAEAEPETVAPKPEPKLWKPRPARPEPLELSGGLPPPMAEPIVERVRRAVLPPSPPPSPPPPPPPNYGEMAPAGGGYTSNLPVAYKKRSWKWLTRSIAVFVVLFIVAVAWLALTAPLSK